jgi:hypothetical protein
VQAGISVSVDESKSTTTLQESTQTFSASDLRDQPAFGGDVADCCLYDFGSYLFGLKNPNGTFQTFDLKDHSGNPIDVQTTGPMVVGFVANPIPDNGDELSCGGHPPWWVQVYNLPDVAVIHPERWAWHKSQKTATFNPAMPGISPLNQPIFHGRGVFITEANSSGGPSLSEAVQGDVLTIAARIYNLSFFDTNDPSLAKPAASVQVRVYGQLYNTQTDELEGNSFLIGQTSLTNIPGFKSSSETGPNWRDALVSFDTGSASVPPLANQSMVFWLSRGWKTRMGTSCPRCPITDSRLIPKASPSTR